MSLNFRIERHGAVASTNDIARRRAEAGESEGLVVTATRQLAGRGRHGRTWSSPEGNLYTSILLRPNVPIQRWPSLSLVVSLSLAEAIGPRAGLKWPNDVLIGEAKTAGILLESQGDAVIVGIGVNIASKPQETAYPATCLHEAGLAGLTAEALLDELLPVLAANYGRWRTAGFRALRSSWLMRAPRPGAAMRLRQGEQLREASFIDVDEEGGLIVDKGQGRERLASAELLPIG